MTASWLQPLHLEGRQLQIESQWLSAERRARPLVVFLHEGLGSLSQWRDFPQRLCDALQCRGLLFSRPGYGNSTPRTEPWPQDYLQRQTRTLLPAYFDALGLQHERLFLFGHSDGASLALLFAAAYPARVRGLAALAPHLFVEPMTLAGLRQAKQAFESGRSLRAALARHHADVDSAFYGWNDAWLRPGFEQWNIEADLRGLACPVLALQGEGDEYGSLAQIEAVGRIHADTRVVALAQCGHAPQKDQPEAVIAHTRALLPEFS
ncbi:alpha/beta hydrolase [Paucibacter sediminis]|uniref:Alpha/beta hydrolase n=1 Tax=Paucibacter sediminis TaxID=3019553 RepID=A0AA95ND44_9BURK|nr:alpha/beta hydrolase [Paucibacter sp. S2-9]WIT12852.1 alpha/beta hydrolase [Paucibacter sp. S2-9]